MIKVIQLRSPAGSVLFLEHKPGFGPVRQGGVNGNVAILMRGSLSVERMPEKGLD